MEKFRKLGVYAYVPRGEAMRDSKGKLAKVKWVRINTVCRTNRL